MPSWLPPKKPNPETIFREALADAAAGEFDLALQKHEWFHEHALRFDRSWVGVRLSYALSAWKRLAQSHPPALRRLRNAQSRARKNVLHLRKRRDVFSNFHDFRSINEKLEESGKTVRFFRKLHRENPTKAAIVYQLAEESLVAAGQFEICAAYIEPKDRFRTITHGLKANIRLASDPSIGADHANWARAQFATKTARLVFLLAVTGRSKEAHSITRKAERLLTDPGFRQQLRDALNSVYRP